MVCFGFRNIFCLNIFPGNLIENASTSGAKTRMEIETVYNYYV